jgi:uncharacterized protein DUF4349
MRQREEQLSAEVRRELEALDRALAGEGTGPELEGLDTLVRELRAARPRPSAGFAAELDESAADGFRSEGSPRAGDRLRTWLTGLRPMQVLAPAGAVATIAVVVSVAVIRSDGTEHGAVPPDDRPAAAPAVEAPPAASDGESSAQEQFRLDEGAPETTAEPSIQPVPPLEPARPRLAPGQRDRAIESSAQVGLSTDADEFDEVADGVVAVTDRYNGLVVSSDETTSGETSRASFELAIPSDRLRDALADISGLAHVESRSEATRDITAPTVSARAELTDAQAEVDALLRQLAEADTPADTREIRARLEMARAQVAQARDQVRALSRRADLATVLVTVTADGGGEGEWGVEEALDDVGDVLSTTAGVTLVALAVLVPLALVLALIALAYRLAVRRGRERTLDDA